MGDYLMAEAPSRSVCDTNTAHGDYIDRARPLPLGSHGGRQYKNTPPLLPLTVVLLLHPAASQCSIAVWRITSDPSLLAERLFIDMHKGGSWRLLLNGLILSSARLCIRPPQGQLTCMGLRM